MQTETLSRAFHELCRERLSDFLDLSEIELELSDSPDLHLRIRSPYDEELESQMLELYFDWLYLAGVEEDSRRYFWDWVTPQASFHLEVPLNELPGTHGITQDHWEKFKDGFVYLVNGEPRSLPAPEEFLAEDEHNS